MATYSNQHWLLCHIRNSFISTDDSGMCETVMLSDDLPKHFLRNYQSSTPKVYSGVQEQTNKQQNRKSLGSNGKSQIRYLNIPLNEDSFVSYPGLDESDDDDMDFSAQSFDIQMYPEVGAHRFRSNTAQKLEKMDIARRKAARTKSVNFDDEIVTPERNDFFQRKDVTTLPKQNSLDINDDNANVKSRLSLQLENFPKQAQNKFMEYARFDGTSQTSMATKRFNVFLSMLPERERNYPIRICAAANAKIFEVIGLICFKATAEYPELPLKSVRNYALYMTEDNDDLEDFPPLDNREPCSKFGFQYLTLAEQRPQISTTSVDIQHNLSSKSLTSEDERNRLAVRSLISIELNGAHNENSTSNTTSQPEEQLDDYEEQMLSHNDMLEAPLYRTYRLQIIDKRFFKTDVTLGVSGERIEIDQHKNVKFWTKQKAVTFPIEVIAFCEITERRQQKGMLRIWLRASSTSSSAGNSNATLNTSGANASVMNTGGGNKSSSPSNLLLSRESPFAFITGAGGQGCIPAPNNHAHIRFKSYDFVSELQTVEHINKKLNYILEVRSSEVRREFIEIRERKHEKSYSKKSIRP